MEAGSRAGEAAVVEAPLCGSHEASIVSKRGARRVIGVENSRKFHISDIVETEMVDG